MARVNVDESAMAAARRIAKKLGERRATVIGLLVSLWRESQILEATSANQDDLMDWLELKERDWPRWRDALVEYGILSTSSESDELWVIVGNDKHILNLREKKEKARENGKQGGRPKKPTLETDVGYSEKPAPVTNENQRENHSAVQFSAVQCSTVQKEENTNTHTREAAPRFGINQKEVSECIEEWRTTLKHLEIDRAIGARDEIEIARAIQNFSADWVKLAFQGVRKQVKTRHYDPKNFVSLSLYLNKDKIERLVNIGAGKESAEGVDWNAVFGRAS